MRQFLLGTALVCVPLAPIGAAMQEAAPAAAAQSPEDIKAAKAAAKAEEKRQRELRAKYGLGPYPDEIAAYVDTKPEALRPYYRNLFTQGERNAVLNFKRLGLAAMQAEMYKEAEWAFDRALERIEAVYANNPQANAARSIFHNESNKDFKGEPYERAMAYYYRGLLYLRAGDFSNARASFKSAEYQDTLSDSETFEADFAVMNYLIGWTFMCEGQASSATEAFALATKANADLVAPAEGDNVLFVSELGNGPVKARDGAQAQKLLFQAGPSYEENAAYIEFMDGGGPRPLQLRQASSVTYQATTRGGRAIDGLMNGKAAWKDGTGAVGDALMNQGLANMGSDGGMAMAGIGLALSLFSSAMKTKADIRAWDGLPDLIMVGTAKASKPDWNYKVTYRNGDAPLDLSGVATRADAKPCSIVWSRARPASLSADVIGEDPGVAAAVARKKGVAEKNKSFRAALLQ
jgi:tetratricopeptide (TPR) repeat protein